MTYIGVVVKNSPNFHQLLNCCFFSSLATFYLYANSVAKPFLKCKQQCHVMQPSFKEKNKVHK